MSERKDISAGPIVALFIIFIVILVVYLVLPGMMKPTTNLRLGDGIFHAKLATNDTDRVKGLSNVADLPSDQALIMIFPSDSEWGIWMKDMKIPIDIVWLDKSKKVIHFVKNVSPSLATSKTFQPESPARYVIELAAGTVDDNSISLGSTATFEIDSGDIK